MCWIVTICAFCFLLSTCSNHHQNVNYSLSDCERAATLPIAPRTSVKVSNNPNKTHTLFSHKSEGRYVKDWWGLCFPPCHLWAHGSMAERVADVAEPEQKRIPTRQNFLQGHFGHLALKWKQIATSAPLASFAQNAWYQVPKYQEQIGVELKTNYHLGTVSFCRPKRSVTQSVEFSCSTEQNFLHLQCRSYI